MSRVLPPWMLLLFVTTACSPTAGPMQGPASTRGAIVGGVKTTGWPAVGALVADVPGYGYMGPFCTGTLIAPRWVLTAAHCVSSYQGMPILPFFVKFYVGTDANAPWGGRPQTGQLYQADEFYPHPDYDPSLLTVGHDIGLVRLKTDVAGVEPVPISRWSLRGRHLGSEVLYVGFGVSDGIKQTGSGVKRETTMPLTWFDSLAYYTEPQGSGTCNGDSGGPGLLQMDDNGTWFQIGVVSAGTESPTTPGDPCLTGIGIYTRVDVHLSWIAEITGLTFPPCEQGVCLCDEACRPDGGCDDTACRTRTCLESVACASGCDAGNEACRMDCRALTRPDDEVAFDKIAYCIDTKCKTAPDLPACVQSACASQWKECVTHSGSGGDCATYAGCREACAGGSALCPFACDAGATEGAKAAWVAADTCLVEADCAVPVTPLAVDDPCAREHCEAEIAACFPPPPCDPLGGTCAEGTACVLVPGQGPRCVASGGLAEGDTCDPDVSAPCADGFVCANEGEGAVCRQVCRNDADCDGGTHCERPEGAEDGDLGTCQAPEPVHSDTDLPEADDVRPTASEPSGDDLQGGDSTRPDSAEGNPVVSHRSGGGCATGPAGSVPWPLVLLVVVVVATRPRPVHRP